MTDRGRCRWRECRCGNCLADLANTAGRCRGRNDRHEIREHRGGRAGREGERHGSERRRCAGDVVARAAADGAGQDRDASRHTRAGHRRADLDFTSDVRERDAVGAGRGAGGGRRRWRSELFRGLGGDHASADVALVVSGEDDCLGHHIGPVHHHGGVPGRGHTRGGHEGGCGHGGSEINPVPGARVSLSPGQGMRGIGQPKSNGEGRRNCM